MNDPARAGHVADHIYPLDVLRFVCAFAVMAFHLCFYTWANHDSAASIMMGGVAHYEALAPWTWFGWVGVEVFFVISGFVIAHSASGATPAQFLKGRILRLYPAVWVCATVTLLGWMLINHTPLAELALPYLNSMLLWIHAPWIDGVYWSLAVEIVFYTTVFWALVASRWVKLEHLPWWLMALTLSYEVLNANFALAERVLSPVVVGKVEYWFGTLLLRFSGYFAVGVWLWMLQRGAMSRRDWFGLGVAVVLCVLEIHERVRVFPTEVHYQADYPLWAPLTAWFGGVALVFAAAVRPQLFAVRTPLLQRALKRIGLMTYPLFLVHAAAGAGLIRVFVDAGVGPWAALGLAIAAALIAAYLVSVTGEVAIRAVLRKWLDRAESGLRRVRAFDWLFSSSRA